MTSDDIESYLKNALCQLKQTIPNPAVLSDIDISMQILRLARDTSSPIGEFYSRVSREEGFGLFRNGIFSTSIGPSQLQDHMLPTMMLLETLQGSEVKSLIADIKEFATTRSSSIDRYFAVAGVTFEEIVNISTELSIVPWPQVPECRQKSALEPSHLESYTTFPFPPRPCAAIKVSSVCKTQLHPAIELSSLLKYDAGKYFEDQRRENFLIEDLIGCCILASGRLVDVISNWPFVQHPIARKLLPSSHSFHHGFHDRALVMASTTPTPISQRDLLEAYANLQNFKGDDLTCIRLGLSRLNSALKRNTMEEQAIDFGIALETVLLHKITEKSELKFRLAVRGARFISGSSEEQYKNFESLKQLYDLRSKSVHEGRLDPKKAEKNSAILERGKTLLLEVTRKLFRIGRFPDWEKEYLFDA